MKYPLTLVALSATVIMASSSVSQAQLIAYEGFNYTSGDALNSLNGGTGWAGAWSTATFGSGGGTTTGTVNSSGLSYSGVASTGLAGFLDVARPSGTNFRGIDVSRSLASSISSGSVWISWLYQNQDLSISGTSGTYNPFSLVFSGGTNHNRIEIGRASSNPWGTFVVGLQGGPNSDTSVDTGVSLATGTTYLLTARIDFNISGTADAVRVWIDPSTASTPLDSAAAYTSTTLDFGTLTGVRLQSGFFSGTSSAVNNETIFDEIRIGSDYLSTIPEPTSLVTILMGLGLLFGTRRSVRRQ